MQATLTPVALPELEGLTKTMRNGDPCLNLTAPVRVAVIDVAEPLADLDCGRPEQPPYTAALILVCQAGRPLGSIEIALHDPDITAAELESEVQASSPTGGTQGPKAAHEPPLPLARASVVVPTNFARPAELRRCLKSLSGARSPRLRGDRRR